jgi:hypothetical protein
MEGKENCEGRKGDESGDNKGTESSGKHGNIEVKPAQTHLTGFDQGSYFVLGLVHSGVETQWL